jgi:deoxyribodipyrimidine photolyase-related protein
MSSVKRDIRRNSISRVVLWEHPQYFTKYSYNKIRLVMHRVSMRAFYEELKSTFNVSYWNWDQDPSDLSRHKVFVYYTPDRISIPKKEITVLDSPNFMLTDVYQEYREKTDKFFFNSFYTWGKRVLNIMPDVKSKDKNNRKTIPKKELKNVPKSRSLRLNHGEIKLLESSIAYVEKHFKYNPGPEIRDWYIPFTRKHALRYLKRFIKERAENFGKYQDFMYFTDKDCGPQVMYHSFLSSSLNMGLLNPSDVIKEVLKIKDINSREAYIRQLFWREYQVYCYLYCDELSDACVQKNNYFQNTKNIDKSWYNGTTGVFPVDRCIVKAFNTGYLHHIERLMVIGNFMLLSGIKPKDGFKWFMEFSIDSYEWVMHQNVYDMVFYITGGKTMRRPYISSSNYILKMSDLTQSVSKEWSDRWDELYHGFLKKHKGKIGYPYE